MFLFTSQKFYGMWGVLQAVQEQVTSAVQEIGHLIEPISTAARGEAAQLGHKVRLLF